ncbi:MAG: matrixin family metalloprotease [Deltaproteobacteria bacterium]|jgi:hypothetical protein
MTRTISCALLIAASLAATPAHAFRRLQSDCPQGGASWDFSTPVQVHVATDSFFDYLDGVGITGVESLVYLLYLMADIDAVIEEYNTANNTFIRLEAGDLMTGDIDLASVKKDDSYPDHSIVVGFTSNINKAAVGGTDPDLGGCTYVEAHARFNKSFNWIFGPPDDLGLSAIGFPGGSSFRAILLHEIGHTLGLAHAKENLSVMAYGVDAWTRGANEVPRAELFPDDLLGLQVTYEAANPTSAIDLTVSNTWFETAAEAGTNKAKQVYNCKVSPRFDTYADIHAGAVYCGVDPSLPAGAFPIGGYEVCAGDYVQVRYTLNNRSTINLITEEQLWFSEDQVFEVNGAAADLQSPDTRTFDVPPMSSKIIGRVFRVPAGTPDGTYNVYARVKPMTGSGVDLLPFDVDIPNNSIRLFGEIVVDASACP